ncbi:hypothetical protein D7X87_05800 [bacterium D16-54]|nr:hypothetical protein D7X87_05800 [bacterium D16-54]RKJ15921.1 hypothetical protein D7X65_05795 [bacterium D16-56]
MKESNYKKTKKKLPQNSSFLQDTIFLYCEYLLCQLYLDAGLRFAATFFFILSGKGPRAVLTRHLDLF